MVNKQCIVYAPKGKYVSAFTFNTVVFMYAMQFLE